MQQFDGYDGTHNSAAREPPDETCPMCTLGIVAVVGASIFVAAYNAESTQSTAKPLQLLAPHVAAFDPSKFALNALLVPALDADQQPARWVDPTGIAQCGPATRVKVNGEKLVPGSLVPATPFKLSWRADACHPFGAQGPRFDGGVTLIVFPLESGYNAMIQPAGMSVRLADGTSVPIRHGWVGVPPEDDSERAERMELAIGH